ncbi:MAG: single-stranded DNA-binding protein [Defluviitaleaceae bacterium]|nr:single-stranded DNA-binding protein [Defluviitaleaceae bacterium]
MLNKVLLMGRLTADPILRHTRTNNVPVASFAVAVDRRLIKDREKETDFFNVVAWQSTAEFVNKNFTKGQMICIEGRLQQRSWTDEATGQKRYAVEVIAESVHFAGHKKESQHSDAGYSEDFNPYDEAAQAA